MDDYENAVVRRLRGLEGGPYVEGVLKEAADRIESLEKLGRLVDWYQEQYPELVAEVANRQLRIETLEKALREIEKLKIDDPWLGLDWCQERARVALKGEE